MRENGKWRILVATGDTEIQELAKETLGGRESSVITVSGVHEFFEELLEGDIDLVIYDPAIVPLEGTEAFSIAKSFYPNIPSVLVYQEEKYEVTRSLLEKGIIYRLLRPVTEEDLKQIWDVVRHPKT